MASEPLRTVGNKNNFWIWSKDRGFDLTHPSQATDPPVYPRIPLRTSGEHIAIDPKKTALVVMDLQNYFLSPLLGRPPDSLGLDLATKLVDDVLPACRKAGIAIVWLGWGLDESDLDDIPPAIARGYDFPLDRNFIKPTFLGGLGEDIGQIKLRDGTVLEAGRVMMRDQWNTALYPSLEDATEPQDIRVNKNRLSGFWGGTDIQEELSKRGIRTLLFSGENTDQCVAASMRDACTQGWDTLMLSDAYTTTSPSFARQCVEYNCENGWGFVLSCQQLIEGIDNMRIEPES